MGGGGIVRSGASFCSDAGICWEHPLPAGNSLQAAQMISPDEWWLAGTLGTVLHYRGGTLSVDPPPGLDTEPNFLSLWGLPGGDVLLSGWGSHAVYRHSDAGWSPVAIGGLTQLQLGAPLLAGDADSGTVWLVARQGVGRLQPDGDFSFSPYDFGGDTQAAGAATSDGFFVSFWDNGPNWLSSVTVSPTAPVADQRVFLPDGGLVTSLLRHTDGTLWLGVQLAYETSFVVQGLDAGSLRLDFGGVNPGDFTGMYQLPDSTNVLILGSLGYIATATPNQPNVMFERSPHGYHEPPLLSLSGVGGACVAGGVGEVLLRTDAGQWSTLIAGDTRYFIRGAVQGDAVVGVGNAGLVVVRDGGEWRTVDSPTQNNLRGAAWLDGKFVTGDADLFQWIGTGWKPLGCPPLDSQSYEDIAVAGDDVWATTGFGDIAHYRADAGCVLEVIDGGSLHAIAARSPSRVFTVGDHGIAWKRDLADGGWERVMMLPDTQLLDVAATSTTAYAVDNTGEIFDLSTSEQLIGTQPCGQALVAIDRDGGDLLISAGSSSSGNSYLCVGFAGTAPTVLRVPTDQGVEELATDGRTLWIFGDTTSVLSWPIPGP
jgi:hypothetical protein